jgi:hypothetical protein
MLRKVQLSSGRKRAHVGKWMHKTFCLKFGPNINFSSQIHNSAALSQWIEPSYTTNRRLMEHRAYQGTLVEGEVLVHSHNPYYTQYTELRRIVIYRSIYANYCCFRRMLLRVNVVSEDKWKPPQNQPNNHSDVSLYCTTCIKLWRELCGSSFHPSLQKSKLCIQTDTKKIKNISLRRHENQRAQFSMLLVSV